MQLSYIILYWLEPLVFMEKIIVFPLFSLPATILEKWRWEEGTRRVVTAQLSCFVHQQQDEATMTPQPRWWKRAKARFKDNRSIMLARSRLPRHQTGGNGWNPKLEAAIIKATSHDDDGVDYKNVSRVLTWAISSPSSSLQPLMRALAYRLEHTRSWVVALKGLMLVHGILLCPEEVPSVCSIGRLPFDLSSFQDRSAKPSKSCVFSVFVREYFNFVDHRSVFLNYYHSNSGGACIDEDKELAHLQRLERMQDLLGLLMQIRPYGDGVEVSLIMEAMDCIVVEIFDIYSGICNGIVHSLTSIIGSASSSHNKETRAAKGLLGIRILRKATEQSSQLSAYLDLCRRMGVLNASELPRLESISDEDIHDLELLVMGGISEEQEQSNVVRNEYLTTVVPREWVMFDDELQTAKAPTNNTSVPLGPLMVWECQNLLAK